MATFKVSYNCTRKIFFRFKAAVALFNEGLPTETILIAGGWKVKTVESFDGSKFRYLMLYVLQEEKSSERGV